MVRGKIGKGLDSFETWLDNAFNVNYVRDKFDSLFADKKFLGDGPDFSGWAEKMQAPFVTGVHLHPRQVQRGCREC
ncbi:hypothetical protein [Mycolicibacterium aichiense]|uniref:hypothetical protein n=1 Tax=Mycolicibacterium aichiense TaxID=1799 RepID=UPI000DF94C18|nr:hypothetical protein [Mycolicibacterium aichiense]SUA14440.1 Uncharacterised protein [Mycolicibacterium aichiense]